MDAWSPQIAGGEMGERIRRLDWSQTPIGPIESWSPALRMTVGLMLANPYPMLLWWGPQYVSILWLSAVAWSGAFGLFVLLFAGPLTQPRPAGDRARPI